MIYLDNAATTKPSRRAMRVAKEAMENDWLNPSSLYKPSVQTSQKIKQARADIAKLIGFEPGQITFTSGSTEANNMVIWDVWDKIYLSATEHDSVYNTACQVRCELIPVTEKGIMSFDALEEKLANEEKGARILVSAMAVNNEIGSIMDINTLSKICKKYKATLHVDATQCMGKIDYNYKLADIITASAHKFHGLKGCGFIASKVKLSPYLIGGHQEDGRRAGTENTVGILSMVEALKECYENIDENYGYVLALKQAMMDELDTLEDIRYNSNKFNPYVLNVSFKNTDAESLLMLLDLRGICVSSGSACNSKATKVSRILQAIKVPDDYIYGTLRISFSADNTRDEVVTAAKAIVDVVNQNRRVRIR